MLLNQQIAGRVAAAYWTAVTSLGIEKLLEEDLHAVDEIVRYNKERVDAGAMRGIDLIRDMLAIDFDVYNLPFLIRSTLPHRSRRKASPLCWRPVPMLQLPESP